VEAGMKHIQELALETLSQKHRRELQEKCEHLDIYRSCVNGVTNAICMDCFKWWQYAARR
jgi:hypothetical protein